MHGQNPTAAALGGTRSSPGALLHLRIVFLTVTVTALEPPPPPPRYPLFIEDDKNELPAPRTEALPPGAPRARREAPREHEHRGRAEEGAGRPRRRAEGRGGTLGCDDEAPRPRRRAPRQPARCVSRAAGVQPGGRARGREAGVCPRGPRAAELARGGRGRVPHALAAREQLCVLARDRAQWRLGARRRVCRRGLWYFQDWRDYWAAVVGGLQGRRSLGCCCRGREKRTLLRHRWDDIRPPTHSCSNASTFRRSFLRGWRGARNWYLIFHFDMFHSNASMRSESMNGAEKLERKKNRE